MATRTYEDNRRRLRESRVKKRKLLEQRNKSNGTFKPDPSTSDTKGKVDTTDGTDSEGKPKGRIIKNPFRGPTADSSTGIFLSYPESRGKDENTGDTLLIKCLEYQPGGENMGLDLTLTGAFKQNISTGELSIITNKERKENPDLFPKKPGIDHNFIGGNQRMLEKQKIKYYIELPAPQEVNDSNSITWGDNTLNALELAALNVAKNAMKGQVGADAVQAGRLAVQALQTGVDLRGAGVSTEINDAIRAAISGAAVGAFGGNVTAQSVIARSSGQILNSNTELLFQGVNLRTFPFSVTFTPRSASEAEIVRVIIKSLKQSMAAKAGEFNGSSATGIFLKSPDVFSLRYMHNGKDHPFLNAFKICALTGMSVNYTNAGTYASYEDGTPIAVRLNMTFKEINPLYNEDYEQAEAGPGVGY